MARRYGYGSTFVIYVFDRQLVHLLKSDTHVWLNILDGIVEDRNCPCCQVQIYKENDAGRSQARDELCGENLPRFVVGHCY